MSRHVSVLVGTSAYNTHAQNMARALYETGSLYRYVTSGVDSFRSTPAQWARALTGRMLPALDRQLTRRAVCDVPSQLVRARWGWELARLASGRLTTPGIEDWCWERGELALDRYCARAIAEEGADAFLGVEFGALAALRAARLLGKPGLLTFMSPHHRARERWVDAEYDKFPELRLGRNAGIERLTRRRDARRDEEASEAAWIVTNSSFTTNSLVEAGFPIAKILTVPLGGPEPITPRNGAAATPLRDVRFVYAGAVSVHKGAHYLLRAWRRVSGPGLSLHFYGKVMLPREVIREAQLAPGGETLVFHGPVPAREMPAIYQGASVLVLPTLCDGFGAVVTEALANGLPVITTRNAGAADMVTDGTTGFVIPPADEDALSAVLQWCVDHPSDLADMRGAALAAAKTHTWRDFRARFRAALAPALYGVHLSRGFQSDEIRVAG